MAYNLRMLKWLVVFALVCVVFSAVLPRLARFGIGRIPGDLRFRVRDTDISIPLGSTALFAICFWLIGLLF
jgi:hypothetical protein